MPCHWPIGCIQKQPPSCAGFKVDQATYRYPAATTSQRNCCSAQQNKGCEQAFARFKYQKHNRTESEQTCVLNLLSTPSLPSSLGTSPAEPLMMLTWTRVKKSLQACCQQCCIPAAPAFVKEPETHEYLRPVLKGWK